MFALVVKLRDGHQVGDHSAHITVRIDMDGIKDLPGIWIQAHERAKFWTGVRAELASRGVNEVLIVCADGLTGFPEAVEATWPQAIFQTRTVHLIRAPLGFIGYKDRLRAAAALDEFEASPLGVKYPATVKTWRHVWERFIPFLAFPPELSKIVYTTNAMESLNYQLRKNIKNHGHFGKYQGGLDQWE